MALINKAVNEITVKLVYYGPGLCGKTTNLEKIFADPKLGGKGKMLSVATETDRTLFFDFMPMEIGTIRGQKVRVQLYTVPGQVFYDATRRLVLRGADGVVFVADSQRPMGEANLESYRNLRDNLVINRIDPDKIPVVFQYNKRDLKEINSVEEMDRILNPDRKYPTFEAVALAGKGVTQTLQKGIAMILSSVGKGVDLTLDEREGAPPPRMTSNRSAAVAPAPVSEPAPPVPFAAAAPAEDPFGSEPAPIAPSPGPFSVPSALATFQGEEEDPFADSVPIVIAEPPAPISEPEMFSAREPEIPEPEIIVEPEAESVMTPSSPSISPELLRALYQGTEQSLSLLRSIVQDLEQQQAALKRHLDGSSA